MEIKDSVIDIQEPVSNCTSLEYPEWARWKAVDADGSMYVFENKPVLCSVESYPFELENTFTEVASVWGDPTYGQVALWVGGYDWKATLEELV